ncbi:MAG TPA: DUF1566 domain-containing protein [bacterium]|nr:DUF1566 domain-containing protein [bacterium]
MKINILILLVMSLFFISCGDENKSENDSDVQQTDIDNAIIPDTNNTDDEIVPDADEMITTDFEDIDENDAEDADSIPDENDSEIIPDEDKEPPLSGQQEYPVALKDTERDGDFTVSDPAGNEEKIVTDKATGLIWQQVLPESYSGCTKKETVDGDECTWKEAIKYCEDLVYAGISDWILPTSHELLSIVDYGKHNPAIYSAFSGTPDRDFWSITGAGLDQVISTEGWSVNFSAGSFGTDDSYPKRVRCVNKSEALKYSGVRFTETTGSDTLVIVKDGLTDLEWTKEFQIGHLAAEAKEYCEGLSYGDKTGWRVPEMNEMRSLVDHYLAYPATSFPEMPPEEFWTSREYAASITTRWQINFYYGDSAGNYLSGSVYRRTRCVRSGDI